MLLLICGFCSFCQNQRKNNGMLPFGSSHSSDSWNLVGAKNLPVCGDKIMSNTENFLKHLHNPGRNGCHGVTVLCTDKNLHNNIHWSRFLSSCLGVADGDYSLVKPSYSVILLVFCSSECYFTLCFEWLSWSYNQQYHILICLRPVMKYLRYLTAIPALVING